MAVATFMDIAGPWPPLQLRGPWAWFRLFDEGRPQRESDQRVALGFQNVSHRARVIVEADSIRKTGRSAQGVRLIKTEESDRVTSASLVEAAEEETEETPAS